MMYDYYSFGGSLGFLFNLVIWGLIIWAIVYFVKRGSDNHNKMSERDKTPLDILNERYAKGEIEKKEYEEKKEDILKK